MIRKTIVEKALIRLLYSKLGKVVNNWFRRRRNKKLLEELPFLRPLNWDGSVDTSYDYTWTHLDNFPRGWHKLIVKYLREVKSVLVRYGQLDKLIIVESKEKWGEARIYYSGLDNADCYDEIDEIFNRMSAESGKTCCVCGRKAEYQTLGWILPFCEKCIKRTSGRNRKIEN